MPGCRKCGIESGYVTRSTYLSALARADAAEKRVAEWEARAERIHDDALRAGIREGTGEGGGEAGDTLGSFSGGEGYPRDEGR